MKGFKDSTKMLSRHDCGPKTTKYQGGGLAIPRPGGGAANLKPSMPPIRPIMPRPRVMPNVKMASMRPSRVFAKGGAVEMKGGPEIHGSSVEHRRGKYAYSDALVEHPDDPILRPGYRKGGIHIKPSHKGLFTKKMTGSKKGKLTGADVQRGLHSSSPATRRQANFARMARRGFKPLCGGGTTGGTGKQMNYAEGGGVRRIAKEEVARHVASKPPQGHGVRPRGNLAFMRKPLIGED